MTTPSKPAVTEAMLNIAHAIVEHDTDDICGAEPSHAASEHGRLCQAIAQAIAVAVDEENRVCLEIALGRYGRRTKLADGATDFDERQRQLSCADDCEKIADAIAARRGSK